jgi:hypothetical protein
MRRTVCAVDAPPIEAIDQRAELGGGQPHHAVVDCRPAKRAALELLVHQAQSGAVPSSAATSAASPSMPLRKSTGLVAIITFEPVPGLITSPP